MCDLARLTVLPWYSSVDKTSNVQTLCLWVDQIESHPRQLIFSDICLRYTHTDVLLE